MSSQKRYRDGPPIETIVKYLMNPSVYLELAERSNDMIYYNKNKQLLIEIFFFYLFPVQSA